MTKDTEKLLMDEELNEVAGGYRYKERLSISDMNKLCDRINQLNVNSETKKAAIIFIKCSGGDFHELVKYFLSLTHVDHKWDDIYIYLHELAETE